MATATFSGSYGHNMTLEVWSAWNRQDIASNSSTVNVQARLITNGYASMWGVTADLTVTINGGSAIEHPGINIGTGSSQLIFGRDYNVPHNGDGTKTVGIKISVNLNTGGYGSAMVAFDLPLPTIARASTVGDITGTLGSAMTININRKNSAFKHTVKYNFGALSGTIATNVDTSVSWTPPLNLATAMPKKTSDWGNIVVETYNGSTKIGQSGCILTLNVPASMKPTLGSISLTDSNTAVSNLINTSNTFVQVLSNIKVAFNSAAGVQGSTITAYKAEIVNKSQTTNSNGGTLGIMNYSGSVTVRASVQDSRGRWSDNKDVTATVLPYHAPVLDIKAQRSNSARTTITVTRSATIAPLKVGNTQKNTMSLTFKTAQYGSSTYTTNNGSASGTWTTLSELTNSAANLAGTFGGTKSWEIEATLADKFTTATVKVVVGTDSVLVSKTKDGIGIMKIRERGALDVGGDIYANNKQIEFVKGGTVSNNANDLVTSGAYKTSSNTNLPAGAANHGQLLVVHGGGDTVSQLYMPYSESSVYVRNTNGIGGSSPNWKAWKKLANTDEVNAIKNSSNMTNTGWKSAGYTGSYYKRSGDMLAIRFDFKGNGNTFVFAEVPSSVFSAPQSYMIEIAEWSVSGADTGHVQINAGTGQFNILASKNNQQYRGQILLMV